MIESGVVVIVMATDEARQCMTCHWWFRFDQSHLFGHCVWHNGTRKTKAAKLRFNGILKTQADFGCVDWEQDRRKKVDSDDD